MNCMSSPRQGAMRLLALIVPMTLMCSCYGDIKEDTDTYLSRFIADLWLEGTDVVKIIWRDCSKKLIEVKDVIDHKEYFPKFLRCMKRKTLKALDRSLSPDVVPIAQGVNLVRFEMVDRSENIMAENETSTWSDKELDDGDWRTLALQRMAKVLRTHVIKFDFDDAKSMERVEYRGRRRHQMMTMMMFGIVSIGMVLIPMGFQFLAVLGGKALLLAKMALILASIQGLKKVHHGPLEVEVIGHYGHVPLRRTIKDRTLGRNHPVDYPSFDGFHDRGKIATSPVSYGFYHSYPPYDHYEKRSSNDWPSPGRSAPTAPPPLSVHSWPHFEGNIKVDRVHIATEDVKVPEVSTVTSEPKYYPVIMDSETSPPIFTSIDVPTPLADLTTRPGEVQADFALDLPYNGFRFQTPTTVISA